MSPTASLTQTSGQTQGTFGILDARDIVPRRPISVRRKRNDHYQYAVCEPGIPKWCLPLALIVTRNVPMRNATVACRAISGRPVHRSGKLRNGGRERDILAHSRRCYCRPRHHPPIRSARRPVQFAIDRQTGIGRRTRREGPVCGAISEGIWKPDNVSATSESPFGEA
jgi:hypothetical protein